MKVTKKNVCEQKINVSFKENSLILLNNQKTSALVILITLTRIIPTNEIHS